MIHVMSNYKIPVCSCTSAHCSMYFFAVILIVVGFWILRPQDRNGIWVAVRLLGFKSFITSWFAICLRTD